MKPRRILRSALTCAAVLLVPLAIRAEAAPGKSVTMPVTATHAKTPAAREKSHAHAMQPATARIDINMATQEQLATLPGIDTAVAQKIIEERPYRSVQELVSKGTITKEELVKLRGRVIARPASAASHASPGTDTKKTPEHHGSSEGSTH